MPLCSSTLGILKMMVCFDCDKKLPIFEIWQHFVAGEMYWQHSVVFQKNWQLFVVCSAGWLSGCVFLCVCPDATCWYVPFFALTPLEQSNPNITIKQLPITTSADVNHVGDQQDDLSGGIKRITVNSSKMDEYCR